MSRPAFCSACHHKISQTNFTTALSIYQMIFSVHVQRWGSTSQTLPTKAATDGKHVRFHVCVLWSRFKDAVAQMETCATVSTSKSCA